MFLACRTETPVLTAATTRKTERRSVRCFSRTRLAPSGKRSAVRRRGRVASSAPTLRGDESALTTAAAQQKTNSSKAAERRRRRPAGVAESGYVHRENPKAASAAIPTATSVVSRLGASKAASAPESTASPAQTTARTSAAAAIAPPISGAAGAAFSRREDCRRFLDMPLH